MLSATTLCTFVCEFSPLELCIGWTKNGLASAAVGGAGQGGGGDLAKKSQNPISDLVSMPLQSNFDIGFKPGNRTRYVGNLQPVVPVKLNEEWNLVNRIIVPFVNAPIGPAFRSDGIGDTMADGFRRRTFGALNFD